MTKTIRPPSTLSAFLHYVSLNMLAMLGTSCYILADTFFVANGIGRRADRLESSLAPV